MADYLLPECAMSVQNKTDMFAFRSDMNMLPNNFDKTELCEMSCKEPMNDELLLNCIVLNEGNPCSRSRSRSGPESSPSPEACKVRDEHVLVMPSRLCPV